MHAHAQIPHACMHIVWLVFFFAAALKMSNAGITTTLHLAHSHEWMCTGLAAKASAKGCTGTAKRVCRPVTQPSQCRPVGAEPGRRGHSVRGRGPCVQHDVRGTGYEQEWHWNGAAVLVCAEMRCWAGRKTVCAYPYYKMFVVACGCLSSRPLVPASSSSSLRLWPLTSADGCVCSGASIVKLCCQDARAQHKQHHGRGDRAAGQVGVRCGDVYVGGVGVEWHVCPMPVCHVACEGGDF